MQLHVDRLYHIYNRGNNRKQLFYEPVTYWLTVSCPIIFTF
jgi:hypothetical protein